MKKLLYTLLIGLLIFSACKKEDEEPTNSGNNNTGNSTATIIGSWTINTVVFESDTNFEDTTPNFKDNITDISEMYDTIVIGSGPGGAIAALRLIENNEKVLIIEAGNAYDPDKIEHHSLAQTNLQFYKQGMNFCYGNIPMLFAEGSIMEVAVK